MIKLTLRIQSQDIHPSQPVVTIRTYPAEDILKAHYDQQMEGYRAGKAPHPLSKHPKAVLCSGRPGCFTVHPIVKIPDYSKRYCHECLPQDPKTKD